MTNTLRPRLFAFVACLFVATTAFAQPKAPAWEVERPDAFGLDSTALEQAFAHAASLTPLNSLLIARQGTLVAEQYFGGMTARRKVNIKSASKSVLSALIGIALYEGHLDSLDQSITDFFPEYFDDTTDPLKRTITLRHLLTMTPGLETTSFGNYGAWVGSNNWVRYALNQPMLHPPGGDAMIYSTGTTHLLSAILTQATGTSTLAYARSRLFAPMGISLPAWDRDPQGNYLGGNNMALTPPELLRFGQLYLDDGRYEDQQLIPAAWVHASTRRFVTKTYRGFTYGYLWWIEDFGGYETWFAWGYGGQYVFVVPALDLVVACTSGLTGRPRGVDHNARIYDLLENYVIPAVLSEGKTTP